jgi:hypothetical protein
MVAFLFTLCHPPIDVTSVTNSDSSTKSLPRPWISDTPAIMADQSSSPIVIANRDDAVPVAEFSSTPTGRAKERLQSASQRLRQSLQLDEGDARKGESPKTMQDRLMDL